MTDKQLLDQIKILREKLTRTANIVYFNNLADPEPDKYIATLASALANTAVAIDRVLNGIEPKEAMKQLLENYKKKEVEHD